MINFYSNKPSILPRFFYRNYINQIKKNNINDDEAFAIFEKFKFLVVGDKISPMKKLMIIPTISE